VLVLVFIVLGVLALSGASARLGRRTGSRRCGGRASRRPARPCSTTTRWTGFAAFANPALDPQGVGYNTNQARIAIGSGGIEGRGLFQGTQTNGRFIPEQQTDFIFTVAGEELGLWGGSLLLALLGVVLWRGLRIASAPRTPSGRLVAAGVVCWFAFQSFVNIGMTLGIMPVTGLPLPSCPTAVGHVRQPGGRSGCSRTST
jgi:rod shape determining protein RodA